MTAASPTTGAMTVRHCERIQIRVGTWESTLRGLPCRNSLLHKAMATMIPVDAAADNRLSSNSRRTPSDCDPCHGCRARSTDPPHLVWASQRIVVDASILSSSRNASGLFAPNVSRDQSAGGQRLITGRSDDQCTLSGASGIALRSKSGHQDVRLLGLRSQSDVNLPTVGLQ